MERKFAAIFLTLWAFVSARVTLPSEPERLEVPAEWYQKYKLRGYTQLRYNQLLSSKDLVTEHDRSVGDNTGFLLRRARLVMSGDVSPWLSIYIQADFAGATSGETQNLVQLRDFYSDVFLNTAQEFRLRLGQSKVPYGFENPQSSQHRLALDRTDALNSAVKDERDLGIFAYWTLPSARSRFERLVKDGLKGSGDYGVIGFGIFNGQNANRPEKNNNLHIVVRASYPFLILDTQYLEAGLSAYSGIYSVAKTPTVTGAGQFPDQRLAAHLVYYPQPLGFQAEYNVGTGPRLNDAQTEIVSGVIRGGYLQVMYKLGSITPFMRLQVYQGGKKHEVNAPYNSVNEKELGVEWEIIPQIRANAEYAFSSRTTLTPPYQRISGNLLRFQLQWNY